MHTCMHTHTVHLREEQKRQNPTEERKRFPRKRTALHGHGACDTVSLSALRLGPRSPPPPRPFTPCFRGPAENEEWALLLRTAASTS